jgi:hypothetical protein
MSYANCVKILSVVVKGMITGIGMPIFRFAFLSSPLS